MRLNFGAKLMIIVGTAALAFVVLICTEHVLSGRMDQQLSRIQEQYIPVLKFGPRLEASFDRLRRGLQDSVAAQDLEALEKSRALKGAFLSELPDPGKAVDPSSIQEIRNATEDYYTTAHDISRRLIAGETGTPLVDAISGMQNKQALVNRLLKKITTFDSNTLIEAFSTVSRAQDASTRMLILTSLSCLIAVLLLSLWLSRSVLQSLASLSRGLKRFGQGDFTQPIAVLRRDELGDLARQANQMADRIKGLMKELESFSYSVAHDLRAPLRSMVGFSTILLEDFGPTFQPEARDSLERVMASAKKMGLLIDSLLSMSRLARAEMKKEQVDLSFLVNDIIGDLQGANPARKVTTVVEKNIVAHCDAQLLHIVLTNLVGNAWKFTSKKADARIEFGIEKHDENETYFVRDNGAGFDMQYAGKLFGTFQRLHSNEEFEGTGIGLATVQSIIRRHGGEIWAEGTPNQGAVFRFTLWRGRDPKEKN